MIFPTNARNGKFWIKLSAVIAGCPSSAGTEKRIVGIRTIAQIAQRSTFASGLHQETDDEEAGLFIPSTLQKKNPL
jgi:hypothetical protein